MTVKNSVLGFINIWIEPSGRDFGKTRGKFYISKICRTKKTKTCCDSVSVGCELAPR